ncbi:hypothetical protein GCM10009545_07830 [Saccharopolyspora thermophila]|uniref:Uncharacterized protein n=1 Tax=Saccharopolyspora thermophila TaxID=89367 RepID=A0ABP3LVJ2_9PSEU
MQPRGAYLRVVAAPGANPGGHGGKVLGVWSSGLVDLARVGAPGELGDLVDRQCAFTHGTTVTPEQPE